MWPLHARKCKKLYRTYRVREEQEKILSEGFDGYVTKPIMIDVLLDEMKKVLAL